MFNDFWDIDDKEEAESYLAYCWDIALDSNIPLFKRLVQTIQRHWNRIINYIASKINNGILEGVNSKIQIAKKRARGYRSINNSIKMIYFFYGNLKFSYPGILHRTIFLLLTSRQRYSAPKTNVLPRLVKSL